jgi:hypothetical protein
MRMFCHRDHKHKRSNIPVRQYEFVRAAKTPISFEFSKEQRIAMMIFDLLVLMTET